MKKNALILVGVCLVAGAFYFSTRPSEVTEKAAPDVKALLKKQAYTPSTNVAVSKPLEGLQLYLTKLWAAAEPNSDTDVNFVLEELTAYLKEHPGDISDVVTIFKSESDPAKIALLGRVLMQFKDPTYGKLVTAMASQLINDSPDVQQKQVCLALLAKASPHDNDLLQTVARISQGEDTPAQLKVTAVGTMETWMAKNPDLRDKLLSELVDCKNNSIESLVHTRILQAIAMQNSELPNDVLKAMADSLKTENGAENKNLAAMALGTATGEMKDFALQQLDAAFRTETDLNLRKNLLTQIVRVGGADSAAILQNLPVNGDTVLAQDVKDYAEIVKNGHATSLDEIYRQKNLLESQRVTLADVNQQPVSEQAH